MAIKWLKTGEESAAAAVVHAQQEEKRKADMNKAFRFGLAYPGKSGATPADCESKILFVDGDVGPKGYLTPTRYYEHGFILHQGKYLFLGCPQQNDPQGGDTCPLCEGGDRPYLASLFTVIELKSYKSQKSGEIIPFTRKLMCVKEGMFETVNKLGAKRGGLRGCVFDVSRTKKQASPNGDLWDFQEKLTDFEALKHQYTRTYKYKDKDTGKDVNKTVCLFEPLDYEKELTLKTGDELRRMGLGSPSGAPQTFQDQAPTGFEEGSTSGEDTKTYMEDL